MAESVFSTYWYESGKNDVHKSLYPYLKYLKTENQGHTQELLRNHRMYQNQPVTAFGPYAFYRNVSNVVQQFDSSTLNIVASCVDTMQSRVAGTSRPAVEFVTKGGDWLKQRKAKDLNKYIEGMFYEIKMYDLAPELPLDSGVYGDGYLFGYKAPYMDKGKKRHKVKFERVFPIEIMIDPAEAMLGEPRQIFRTKALTRDKVKMMFPGKDRVINECPSIKGGSQQQVDIYTDPMIEVHECWRLPSYKGAGDGLHVIIIENATLLKEPYKQMFFPFVHYRYKKKRIGWYGESVASQLVRNQVMLNRLLKIVDKSLVSFANPKVWAPAGSSFNPDTFTRDIGGVITSTIKPELLNGPIIPAEVYQWIENVYQKSFQVIGISQQSATGVKQPGITSGTAINAVDDIQSDRLSIASLSYEDVFPETAKIAIALMQEIVEDEGDYSVTYPNRGALTAMHWSEMEIDDDDYVLQANAVSSLPKTVPGKLQYIADMQAMGVLSPYQIPRLISNPDIDQVIDPMMAIQDRIYQKIDNILDKGEDGFEAPDQYLDPQQSLTLFTQAIAKAEYDGAPDDRIALLQQYITQLGTILAPPPPPAPPMQPGAPAPGPVPQGAPMPSMAPAAPLPAQLQAH